MQGIIVLLREVGVIAAEKRICDHQLILCEAFLSWLRLATYMAVVSVAIMISFHLKHEPTHIERRAALPFGLIFWFLALACLVSGLMNYIKTVNRYSRRQALVQTGVATQVVSSNALRYVSKGSAHEIIGIYSGVVCDCCGLCFVPLNECYEVIGSSMQLRESYLTFPFSVSSAVRMCLCEDPHRTKKAALGPLSTDN